MMLSLLRLAAVSPWAAASVAGVDEAAAAEVVPNRVVSPDDAEPPSSGVLRDGPFTYTHVFTTPGTYRYYCAAHGAPSGVGMSGIVVVQPE